MFKTAPYAHQLDAYTRFKDAPYFALYWEMGTGKTKAVIDIAAYKFETRLINKVLIVAPNIVHTQWIVEQFPLHCNIPWIGYAHNKKKTAAARKALADFLADASGNCGGNCGGKMPVLAINIEAFQSDGIAALLHQYLLGATPFWVVDEATRIKNPSAVSVKKLNAYKRQYASGHSCILTGTSLAKRPTDVWSMVEFLQPGYMGCTFTAFNRRHTILTKHNVEVTAHNRRLIKRVDIPLPESTFWKIKSALKRGVSFEAASRQFDITTEDIALVHAAAAPIKYKHIDRLKTQLAPISMMIKKSDCLDLPDKQYKEVLFELTPEQKRAIKSLQEFSVANYNGKTLTVTHKAALQLRALQICGGFFPHLREADIENPLYSVQRIKGQNEKLNYIAGELEELGEAQCIVWAVFTAELNLLYDTLSTKTGCILLSGDTAQRARDEGLAAFKAGEIQCLIANPMVAGYGLNLQNALVQYWYSRNYRTEARLQAEDRSHRLGVKHSPMYIDLVYKCKFERDVLHNIKNGKDMNDYFNSVSVNELFTI